MITNYTELQTAVSNWLDRADSDTVARIPEFVEIVDARLRRKQLTRRTILKILDDVTGRMDFDLFIFADGAPNSSIPLTVSMTDFRSVSLIGVQDEDDPQLFNPPLRVPPINMMGPEDLYAHRSFHATAATPTHAAVFPDFILVSPLPDALYRWQIQVEVAEPLSDTSPTNPVLTLAPDVYLYGALVEAAPYLKDDERVPMWETRFTSALAELEEARARTEYPNTIIQRQPRVFT